MKKMKRKSIAFFASCFLLASSGASASDVTGKVVKIWAHNKYSNHFFWEMDTQNGRPACASFGSNGRFVVDISTAAGRATMSTILTASASAKTVQVGGTGDCSEWGDSESVNWINVRY